MQRTANHCSALQQTATHCNTPSFLLFLSHALYNTLQHIATYCNTLQHTATRCNTQQHTATHCNTLQHTHSRVCQLTIAKRRCNTPKHTETHCNTLQHTATHTFSCVSTSYSAETFENFLPFSFFPAHHDSLITHLHCTLHRSITAFGNLYLTHTVKHTHTHFGFLSLAH